MADEDEGLKLHAAVENIEKRKHQWLQDRGVTFKHSAVELELAALLQYFEGEQTANVSLDELKTTWRAIDEEAAEEINALIEGGADIQAKDERGGTVLHYAARSGNKDVVSLLLTKGADMNAVTKRGGTALHWAAANGKTDVVNLLLDEGADVNAVANGGESALHFAAEHGKTNVVSLLLGRDANVNAVANRGGTALHFAALEGKTDVISLLLDRGVSIDALDKENLSPLGSIICNHLKWDLHEKVPVARSLCSGGANSNLLPSFDTSSLGQHQTGLLECARHWCECYEQGVPLTEIQSEVIEGGENAVRTFLINFKKTRSDQLVYRCKVCIVGPSTWGKTSLVKSITSNEPSLVAVGDHTIGIDLFPFTFDETVNEGATTKVKRHDVTFWDFAGQDIYQGTHALFYSERTLYLICVDLGVYATKLEEVNEYSTSGNDDILQRFFEENVLRWVRLILFRQPSAQFKVIGTKDDLVSKSQLEDILDDMNYHMNSFVDILNKDGITDEVMNALDAAFKSNNLVTTSVDRPESIEQARKFIEQAIIAKSNLSFMMPTTYSQVLAQIFKIKRASKSAKPEDRVKQLIVTFKELLKTLKRKVPDLDDARECREILRVLHKLGDILWYEDKSNNEYELIILDPKLMLDLVREVVNHNYEGQTGESYDALRCDGTLHHSLLMTFSWWKALEAVDDKMVHLFKYLLQHFNLAYPASNVKELDEVDMIVPTYWKTRVVDQKVVKSLTRQPSLLSENDVAGPVIAKWQYSIPFDISEAVYVNFAVRCYRPNVVRKIGAAYVKTFVRGEFGAVIIFVANLTERRDDIVIEVAAATAEIAWAEMREFVMAMESVLLEYPGLTETKQKMFKRYIIDPDGTRNEVSGLLDTTSDVERLQSEMSWLPPDFGWFIQRAWKESGKLDGLLAQRVMLLLPHRLEILKQLVVSSDMRKFPALWTLSYTKKDKKKAEKSVIELRMHSDLSGVCYHVPLRIAIPSKFVKKHTDFIQNGITVLTLISSLVPTDVISTAVGMALPGPGTIAQIAASSIESVVKMVLSASQSTVDRAQTVKSILAKAGLSEGDVKSATEFDMLMESRMAFLRELLTFHDLHFDKLRVSELSNLCCAVDKETGCYVWVHPQEIKEMNGRLTRCRPPNPHPLPPSTRVSISICMTHLMWAGRAKSRKEIYCEWEVVHCSGQASIGKTEKVADSGTDIAWMSPPEQLIDVSSITMLRESTVKIFVKQVHRIKSDEKIGHGEVHLKDHVDTDCSNSSPVEIEIPLEGENIPPSSTVTCEISIVPPVLVVPDRQVTRVA